MAYPRDKCILSYGALADLLERKRAARRRVLVCMDGPGASGKSTIARCLAGANEDIQVVHLDDFYRPSSDRYVGPLVHRPPGADFDLGRLRDEILIPLQLEGVAHYRVYNWSTDQLSPHTISVTKPIVLVEGVYSFSATLSDYFDFSIWVDCPRDVRLARGLARDGESARSRWEDDWMLGEDQYVQLERPQDRVALVCDGSRDCDCAVVVLRAGSDVRMVMKLGDG